MEGDWLDAVVSRRPTAGELQLWLLRLDIAASLEADLYELLSEDERVRADRFLFPEARRRFVACRGQLRQILGDCLGRPPSSLRFAYSGLGKPSLDEPIQFNVSHSHERALLAVTVDGELGVDIEFHSRRMGDMQGLAKRFFSTPEVDGLFALPESQQRAAFFRIWTRKEAILKATGKGLTYPLNRLTVSFAAEAPAELVAMGDDPQEAARWKLQHVEPQREYVAAVATPQTPTVTKLLRWREASPQ